ncbi:DUF6506 family protein [Allonocardiopsis opalescens]|uniref:Uncharacterized protein n=1 Tax=Allonocardiopsis opalescens TaxID=1144618 RepID=A0A2T0QCH8_9ACTN|nr:DUF6506 family protein [Allonocardiopsis opalescens]PRY01656.1 hypothetical protein CLV72_101240 [Allonocardiopsis opalescens]
MAEVGEMFIFLQNGADPVTDRVVHEHGGGRTLLVWAPDGAAAARVADEQVRAGVRLIELYRGFDLESAGEVIEAVDGRVPVGVAGYGFGTAPGSIGHSVTIYADAEADPAVQRVVREHADGTRTTVLGAPNPAAAAQAAAELVDAGADLVEICGGTPLTTARHVQRALGGRAAVSLVAFPFESIDGAAAFKAAFEAAQESTGS